MVWGGEPVATAVTDVHTVSKHAFSSPDRFESVGQLLLGKESDWAFFYL